MALTPTAQRLYSALAPLATKDAANGYALRTFCSGLAVMFDDAASIAQDDASGNSGWYAIFNIATVNAKWLPWVGQFVGVNLAGVTSVAAQRNLIASPVGFQRGGVPAIIANAQATLTGAQVVLVNVRAGGAWNISVGTYTAQTPNPTATLQALQAAIPAGMVLTYIQVTGGTYSAVAVSHATYSAMSAAHSTYSDIPLHPSA